MGTGTEILVIGTGTAGARAAYYLYQRGGLPGLHILAVDSDADALAMLPTLPCLQVPPPPALPVGAAADNARKVLAETLDKSCPSVKMIFLLTCLGGTTGVFYTQAAMQYAKLHQLPAIAMAGMPHDFDSEDLKQRAATALSVLRAEHFEILTLDCARFGQFFPDAARESAYPQAVRWLAETTLGYLKLFSLPRITPETTGAASAAAKVLNFDELPRGIFSGTFPTCWDDQNLDIPTFLRKNLKLPTLNQQQNQTT